jgi:hypothetical protein
MMMGEDRPTLRPSRFWKIIECDAGKRPRAGKAHGPDRRQPGEKTVEAGQDHGAFYGIKP